MMYENERRDAEMMRDSLKKILPELKLAYENAKDLSDKHNLDIRYWNIFKAYITMLEAYITLADDYIGVIEALEEEDRGGSK